MKNLLSVLALLCLQPLNAQSLFRWSAQPQYTNLLNAIEPAPGGGWYVGGQEGYFPVYSSLAALSATGQLLWKTTFNWQENTEIKDIDVLPDGSVAVCGNLGGCDFFAPGFVAVFENNGQERWRKILSFSGTGSANALSVWINALNTAPDGNIFAAGDGGVTKYDAQTGDVLANYPAQSFDIPADMVYLADQDLFVLGGYSGIVLLSPSQQLEKRFKPATPGAGIIKVFPWKNDRLLGLTNTGVLEEFSFDGPEKVYDPGFQVYDLRPHNSDYVLCGRTSSGVVVRFFDQNLDSLPGGFELGNPNLHAFALRPDADGVLLAGAEVNGPAPSKPYTGFNIDFDDIWNQNFWVQRFDWNGASLPENSDAALTEVIELTPPKVFPNGLDKNSWVVVGASYSARITNTGKVPLYSVNLNAGGYGFDDLVGDAVCWGKSHVFKQLTGLNLAPGADTVVYLGFLESTLVQSINPWKVCVWTSLPNGQADGRHTNDYTCKSYYFATDATEPATSARNDLKLFPNPAHDALFVELPEDVALVLRLYNSQGQLVLQQTSDGGSLLRQIDLTALPRGFYTVQTALGRGRFVKE